MQPKHKANESKTDNAGRGKPSKGGPWCWCEKEILQMIRDHLTDGHGHCAEPLSVYLALTQLASDKHSETFTATISQIATLAGVSYRTTWDILNRLETLKVIRVQRNTLPGTKGNAPSNYTLCATNRTLCKREASRLPRLKKKGKNLNKPPIPPTGGQGFVNVSRLRRLPNHVLKRKREECLAEKNKLYRQYGKNGNCPQKITARKNELQRVLLDIKGILKGRNIEYAASL